MPVLNPNISGNAATASKLETARTVGGVSFDGSANINLPGVNAAGNQSTTGNAATATTAAACSGNAASATVLQTARTIGGVSFNGSANINLPGVNAAGNQSTTGNAETATRATRVDNGSESMRFNWAGQPGQPTWLWGGELAGEMYVYNPSVFNVASAATATTAAACSGNSATATTAAACSGNSATATKLTTASGSAPSYSARAWVNFTATGGVPSIRASGNVSSITDNGQGDFTVNFATAMQDANYSVSGACQLDTGGADGAVIAPTLKRVSGGNALTASGARLRVLASDSTAYDAYTVAIAIHR